jgi:hypothetical protein
VANVPSAIRFESRHGRQASRESVVIVRPRAGGGSDCGGSPCRSRGSFTSGPDNGGRPNGWPRPSLASRATQTRPTQRHRPRLARRIVCRS